jgi:hypothetical protein
MDAERLVAEAERAMCGAPQPERIIAEAWQALELTEAVARLLAADEGRPGRAAGPGPLAGGVGSGGGTGPPRAARLTGVRDPDGTLRALRVLLGEIGLVLVGIVGAAADEGTYSQCIDALDAVDEAKDRVRALSRAAGSGGEVH